jgi:putative heme-binding domain-containing protein
LQVAYSAKYLDRNEAGYTLADIALNKPYDSFIQAAVMSSVTQENLEPLLRRVLELNKGKGSPTFLFVMADISRMVLAFKEPKTLRVLVDSLATPVKESYARWQFFALHSFLDELDRQNSSLKQLMASSEPALREDLKRLSALFDAARATMKRADALSADQHAALRLLGRGVDQQEEDIKLLAGLLKPQTTADLQSETIVTLGRMRSNQVPEILLRAWKRLGPGLRGQALGVLLSRQEWTKATLDAIEKKMVLPFEIDAAHRQWLLTHKTPAIRDRAVKLFADEPALTRGKVIDSYRPALDMKGDGKRGQLVFQRTCAACHQLAGVGQNVGPDLAALAGKSPEALLIAILDPNQAVEPRYLSYTATLKNGQTHSGLLASETGNSVTLIGADGKGQTILRTELEDLYSSGKSTMPEGLEKDITPQEMADLLQFLRSAIPQKSAQQNPSLQRERGGIDARSKEILFPNVAAGLQKSLVLVPTEGEAVARPGPERR